MAATSRLNAFTARCWAVLGVLACVGVAGEASARQDRPPLDFSDQRVLASSGALGASFFQGVVTTDGPVLDEATTGYAGARLLGAGSERPTASAEIEAEGWIQYQFFGSEAAGRPVYGFCTLRVRKLRAQVPSLENYIRTRAEAFGQGMGVENAQFDFGEPGPTWAWFDATFTGRDWDDRPFFGRAAEIVFSVEGTHYVLAKLCGADLSVEGREIMWASFRGKLNPPG